MSGSMDNTSTSDIFSSGKGLDSIAESHSIGKNSNKSIGTDTSMTLSDHTVTSQGMGGLRVSRSVIQAASEVDSADRRLSSFLHSGDSGQSVPQSSTKSIQSDLEALPSAERLMRDEMSRAMKSYRGSSVRNEIIPSIPEVPTEISKSQVKEMSALHISSGDFCDEPPRRNWLECLLSHIFCRSK